MRIYAAGFFGASGVRSINANISKMSGPDWVLESYYYLTGKGVEEIREAGGSIFLDSGAFTMFTKGVEIDLKDYAQFIKENSDIFHVASSIDVIGRGKEQESYDNFRRLLDYGAKVQPVHHARDKDDWLGRYLDEGHDYIFLGGMVAESTNYLRDWLDHVWEKYLTNPDGTAKVKVHGFGLTTLDLMFRYPWYSVDSTSWVMTSRYGSTYLDLPQRTFKVDFSSQSNKRFDDGGWHYVTLKPTEKKVVDDRLAELEELRKRAANYNPEVEQWLEDRTGIKQGYYPEALGELYGWRDHFNINFFNRMQHKGTDRFIRPQMGLFA